MTAPGSVDAPVILLASRALSPDLPEVTGDEYCYLLTRE